MIHKCVYGETKCLQSDGYKCLSAKESLVECEARWKVWYEGYFKMTGEYPEGVVLCQK